VYAAGFSISVQASGKPLKSTFPPFNTMGVSCKQPEGGTGCLFDLVGGSDVYRFSDGGLLFVVNELGTACVDLATSFVTYSSSAGLITGGTGKFAGTTGTLSFSGRTQALSSDSAGRSFGWFVTTGTFELTLR
jgi:hypothetical protein